LNFEWRNFVIKISPKSILSTSLFAMQHKYTNHLINETSPYLLQHAHNPVDWFAWGDIALQKAKELDKPILVSIGYSACHWCHVMEKESFENEEVAQTMNKNFINIKIDREERPDLDHIYMDAVQAMTGSGGWPLNVFLTPDGKPFYGGTYFPPLKAFNRSSWTEVLDGVASAWKEKKNEIESQAENLTDYLKRSNNFGQNNSIGLSLDETKLKEQCKEVFQNIMKTADRQWGGFGRAPKFPQFFIIQYLLQYYYFTNDKDALQQALLSIDKMLQGGIYDHVGGGLARYSTDDEWLAPHFEKMLYDNALFINILCDAYQITKDKKYEESIRKIIAFVQRELMNKDGGFYAALDADSQGEEGKYYVWQKEDVRQLLGKESALFCEYFDITSEGNWEGKNILRILKPINEFAKEKDINEIELKKSINISLEKLSSERDKRVKPSKDDKIILNWNALMITALCKAFSALKDESYRKMAEDNFHFLFANFREDEHSEAMLHTYKNGIAKYPAFLDDYSYFIEACINLYEITFDTEYLNKAKRYCNYVVKNFVDNNSKLLFFTHKDQADIIMRKKEIYDSATPSGNAIMASNFLKLSIIYNKSEWKQWADEMVESMLSLTIKYPSSFGFWAIVLLLQSQGINEIVVTGKDYVSVCTDILDYYLPNKIIIGSMIKKEEFPMLEGKLFQDSTLIYLCKNYACLPPVKTAQNLLKKVSPLTSKFN
jgi:uncharacterized protein YyaL (SSP411 family)